MLWLVGNNGVAHLYPDCQIAGAGYRSACGRMSTTLDRDEGDVSEWCAECKADPLFAKERS